MTYLPINVLLIVILIIFGYVITSEIVKLAFFHKIIHPKFGLIFVKLAQNRLFNKIHQKFRTSRFVNKEIIQNYKGITYNLYNIYPSIIFGWILWDDLYLYVRVLESICLSRVNCSNDNYCISNAYIF